MRLISFAHCNGRDEEQRVGLLTNDGDAAIDLQRAITAIDGHPSRHFTDMLAFLDGGQESRDLAQRVAESVAQTPLPEATHTPGNLRLLAPVPRPRSIRDCMVFEQHLVQAMRTVVGWRCRPLAACDRWLVRCFGRGFLRVPRVWHQLPVYYKGNPNSVVGHQSRVAWPAYTERLDYELELGIYIGRRGRDIPVEAAHQHIAGYTIFNDFSARDIQLREMQGRLGPAKGKDFDTGNVMGPWLVTPDEIPDAARLHMTARVNGELWSAADTSQMHFSFEQIIAHISQSETLYPGDFIAAGTVPGGCGLELDRWLQPGDTVQLEVEGLGTLCNTVIRE
jgi:2-keto-4-pentenoate hydratase/2-oxohepta-3-ene-1,7-dioic acid hydratase in catechol pathway